MAAFELSPLALDKTDLQVIKSEHHYYKSVSIPPSLIWILQFMSLYTWYDRGP